MNAPHHPQAVAGGVRQPVRHDSGHKHVTGRAVYVDDIPCPPGTLHAAFGLSDRARARILSMDLAPVRAAPGVVAVLTAADVPGANDVSPNPNPEPMLAEGEVFFHGQPLFAVIAESHLAARRAARLARVEWEDLPAIVTIDQAMAAESSSSPASKP
jgi:Xanthine dehydrogenase, molybdopterin-binding subunit B